jgi:DDE superfamily endonuclease
LSPDIAERVVALTLAGPPAHATHWTGAAMAKAIGISVSSVQRIRRAHGLSNDPRFVAKLRDIVGLYVKSPDHAVVLSVDEKSQIQARDRTQPSLPMKKGRAATVTHDDKRHGTTTLFAAFDVLEGKVIGQCMKRHRHQEFIRFLNLIDARVPTQLTVHVIVDNPKVLEWLARHPRFVFHFTLTSASWLNAVEGLFASWSSGASSAACFIRSRNSRTQSIASSRIPMPTQSHLSGQKMLARSSPPSNEGTKR